MNAKNTKKSPIHENADANITCDFGEGDNSRSRSRLPHGHMASHTVSSIISNDFYVKCVFVSYALHLLLLGSCYTVHITALSILRKCTSKETTSKLN